MRYTHLARNESVERARQARSETGDWPVSLKSVRESFDPGYLASNRHTMHVAMLVTCVAVSRVGMEGDSLTSRVDTSP